MFRSISVDAQGNGWIGTEGGLGKYDGNSWTFYTPSNSNFPGLTVHSSIIDGQGNKWFGTDSHGLVKFDGSNWTTYNTSNSGLPENTVYALAIDGQANKWIGTYSGLAKYNGTNWTAYNSSNSIPDMSGIEILSLAVDGQGNKWIGTWAFGLVKFDGTNWTTYDNSNSWIPSNYVYAITPDAQGNIWIGTHLGVGKFDGINWTTYNESNSGLPNNKVHAIAIDGDGNKWIGTEEGLAKFDGVNWTIYNNANSSLPGDFVNAITIDSHGNKWIGTDKGLAINYGIVEPQQNVLIAHYPLNFTPNDTTGNFGPMTLTNTPYQDGGINCNGIYINSAAGGGCHAETPILPSSIFKSFVVIANFKVSSYSDIARPVFMGGAFYRWIGFNLQPDSTVALLYNQDHKQTSATHYSLNTWHEAKITYDSSNAVGELYLDGTLACSANFIIEHGTGATDRTFGITNFGAIDEEVFKGIIHDLKIFSKSVTPTSVQNNQNIRPDDIQLSQNFPNPFNPATTIEYQLPEKGFVTIKIFDMLGKAVATLVNQDKQPGTYTVEFNASNLASGIYFYQLKVQDFTLTKKMMLLK